MKRIVIFMFALTLLSCSKEARFTKDIVGSWDVAAWNKDGVDQLDNTTYVPQTYCGGNDRVEVTADYDCSFNKDGTCALKGTKNTFTTSNGSCGPDIEYDTPVDDAGTWINSEMTVTITIDGIIQVWDVAVVDDDMTMTSGTETMVCKRQ